MGTGCNMVTMWLKLVNIGLMRRPGRAQHGMQIDSGTKVMVTREGEWSCRACDRRLEN